MQGEEIFDKKLHKLEVRINKLEDIMIDALRSNNIFAMDPELKEIWTMKKMTSGTIFRQREIVLGLFPFDDKNEFKKSKVEYNNDYN